MAKIETVLDGRPVVLEKKKDGLPVLIIIMYYESAKEIEQLLAEKVSGQFNLVCLANLQWDQDLSPWPHHWVVVPDDDFTGQGPEFLKWIENSVMPWTKEQCGSVSKWYLGGYSMGGMFSLFGATVSGKFDGALCISGSVWYPGFVEWLTQQPIPETLKKVYLSTGSTESDVKNKVLAETMTKMKEVDAFYEENGMDVCFQINPGNHFTEPLKRTAEAISWMFGDPYSLNETK